MTSILFFVYESFFCSMLFCLHQGKNKEDMLMFRWQHLGSHETDKHMGEIISQLKKHGTARYRLQFQKGKNGDSNV